MAERNRKRLYTTGKGDCVVTREKIGRPEGKNDKKKIQKIRKFNTQANVERKRLKVQEKNNERWKSTKTLKRKSVSIMPRMRDNHLLKYFQEKEEIKENFLVNNDKVYRKKTYQS